MVRGPGGIGKTSLLEVIADEAATAPGHAPSATVVRLDGRSLPASPRAVTEVLGQHITVPPENAEIAPAAGRLVLLVDAYERLEPLDDWFRTGLLPRLPSDALVVLAGRMPPGPAWRADAGWRDLLRVVSLRNLDPDESRHYLAACGVSGRFNHHVDVAARTVTADREAWERVGRRVYARRRYELDLTAQEVVERAGRGLSLGVLSQIENCRKDSYAERTLIALCRALEWAPDSIQRLLDGGEPVAAHTTHTRTDMTPEEMVEDLQRRVRVLEEEIERWRDQRESTDESRRAG